MILVFGPFSRVVDNVLAGPLEPAFVTNNSIVVTGLPNGLTRRATKSSDSLTCRRFEGTDLGAQ